MAVFDAEAKARSYRPENKGLEEIRLAQRRPEVKPLKEFWYMDTPNCYVEVGLDGVNEYPHPRSEEFIIGLAVYRGGQFQLDYAEAFEVVLRKF